MQRITLAAAGLGAVLALTLRGAQAASPSTSSADTNVIQGLLLAYKHAVAARDLGAMERIWAHKPYVVTVAPGGQTVSIGYDAVIKGYRKNFTPYREITPSIPAIQQLQTDGRMAWAVTTGSVHLRRHDGAVFNYKVIESDVFEKEGNRWYLVSRIARAR